MKLCPFCSTQIRQDVQECIERGLIQPGPPPMNTGQVEMTTKYIRLQRRAGVPEELIRTKTPKGFNNDVRELPQWPETFNKEVEK